MGNRPLIVGTCPPYRRTESVPPSRGPITRDTSRSRSARIPNATTEPAPLPRRPGAADRRRKPRPRFLDVGIGTGIAARQFGAVGCTVLGVEVDARMADFARRDGFEVEVAAFEAWDPGGRAAFDTVVSAQTWHWVDPVAGAAKAAEVLRPGVGWRCSGTRAGPRPTWPNPSPPSTAGYCPTRSPPASGRPAPRRRVRGAVRAGGRRHPGDGRVRRTGAVAYRLGAGLLPGRMAGPTPHHRRPHPAFGGRAD
ncbi:class I SAM-dependent methyltransferase [Streptomyces sp. M19]